MSQTPTAPATPTKPAFTERVNYDTVFGGLAQYGVVLTEEEKTRMKQIVASNLSTFEGGAIMGDDIGGALMKFVYMMVYFLQNAVKNVGNFSIDDFGSWMSARGEATDQATEAKMLMQAMSYTNQQLTAAGGNLARAANIVTGVTPDSQLPPDVSWSVYRQLNVKVPKDGISVAI